MRDLRDPQKLGEALLGELKALRVEGENYPPARQAADYLPRYEIPDYSHDESMAVLTAREYREELEARRQEGDKYAASALDALDRGVKLDDDPSGN